MKITKKEEIKKEEVKQEDQLKEVFVLWKNKGKDGTKDYLTGYLLEGEGETAVEHAIVAFYNTNKENPKQPDIRVYLRTEDGKAGDEVASLWSNVSEKTGNKYLTGKTNEDEKLIGFFTKEVINQRPDIRVYYKN